MEIEQKNPLGEAPVGKLMVKFAVPSIVAMLVSALYNIIDQLFIGQAVEQSVMQQLILHFRYQPPVWLWLCCLVLVGHLAST